MNKINICENFKNENLPLIFNINYEGFSKYNKNETYIKIYNCLLYTSDAADE